MRLASYVRGGSPGYGIVVADGLIDVGRRLGGRFGSLRALLDGGSGLLKGLAGLPADYGYDDITWAPVVPDPGQIICAGLNYRAHVAEVGRPVGGWPTVFLRVAQSQTGHLQPVLRPHVSDQLDFEGELAVVIGATGRHVPVGDALGLVAGYAPYNDVSVRDWQHHGGQYAPGKNFPSTGAFGPWMVTADEVPDPGRLELITRLNGAEVQHAGLGDLIFSVPELIAYISAFTELRPGDVVVTGTPAGVGASREPALWMRPGDTVEVEVPGIAVLANPIAQES